MHAVLVGAIFVWIVPDKQEWLLVLLEYLCVWAFYYLLLVAFDIGLSLKQVTNYWHIIQFEFFGIVFHRRFLLVTGSVLGVVQRILFICLQNIGDSTGKKVNLNFQSPWWTRIWMRKKKMIEVMMNLKMMLGYSYLFIYFLIIDMIFDLVKGCGWLAE